MRNQSSSRSQIEGKPAATINAGEALLIPGGAIHALKNAGSSNAAGARRVFIEQAKPLVVLAD